VTLARARELAAQARANLAEKINPKDVRKPSEGATFGECADRVIEAMRPSWRNSKHVAKWEMTLRDYAAPAATSTIKVGLSLRPSRRVTIRRQNSIVQFSLVIGAHARPSSHVNRWR
jgi:hypothetical protein